MTKNKKVILLELRRKFSHNSLFCVVLLVFTFISLFLAITSYANTSPDEIYHYAAIQAHADSLSPFLSEQEQFAETGDLTRNPSFLYHYIFSFPYRFAKLFNMGYLEALVLLRLLNVVLGIATILILRRVLLEFTTKRLANITSALFALLPVTQLIYSGLNYDNLLLPLAFGSFLMLKKLSDRPTLTRLLLLCCLWVFGCSTKFSFIPIVAAEVVFTIVILIKSNNRPRIDLSFSWSKSIPLVFACMLAAYLFFGGYGLNLVRYKTPTPACEQVQSLDKCLQYSVLKRDYDLRNTVSKSNQGYKYFTKTWVTETLRGLSFRAELLKSVLFFALNLSLIASLIYRRTGFKNGFMALLFLGTAIAYTIALILINFLSYKSNGEALGISGRYLLPVLPLFLIFLFANLSRLFVNESLRKVVITIAVLHLAISSTISLIYFAPQSTIMPQFRSLYFRIRSASEPLSSLL